MKTLILIIVLLCCKMLTAQVAQTVYDVRLLNTNVKCNLVKTSSAYVPAVLTIKARALDLYQTSTGQYYCLYEDSTGQHRRYLGWLNTKGLIEYESMSVFRNSTSTEFYYIQIDSKGLPYLVKVPKVVYANN